MIIPRLITNIAIDEIRDGTRHLIPIADGGSIRGDCGIFHVADGVFREGYTFVCA